MYTPVLLYKSGVQGDIPFTDMLSRCTNNNQVVGQMVINVGLSHQRPFYFWRMYKITSNKWI